MISVIRYNLTGTCLDWLIHVDISEWWDKTGRLAPGRVVCTSDSQPSLYQNYHHLPATENNNTLDVYRASH